MKLESDLTYEARMRDDAESRARDMEYRVVDLRKQMSDLIKDYEFQLNVHERNEARRRRKK